ncbi:MAG TPA: PilC/PilY family type IV pilus protein [Burkholderiaceae bacterium]|nr:PilC/PilY family type IV pilus protein [Burkholderiaceae bacterium]
MLMRIRWPRGRNLRLLAWASWTTACAVALLLQAAQSAHAQTTPAPLPVSNVPLNLSPPLPPNLFLTVDDSGSMAWGHIPDTLYQNLTTSTSAPGTAEPLATGQSGSGAGGPGCGKICGGQGQLGTCATIACGAARGYKSAALNPLYYDPTLTYVIPPDATGTPLATSFAAAYNDGFNPQTSGTLNLATQYRPTSTYFPGSTPAAPWAPGSNQAGLCPNSSNFLCNDWAQHNFADLGALGVKTSADPTYAYYYNYVPSNSGCSGSLYDDNCYTLVKVGTSSGPGGRDETRNFAIWYSFYRTRHLAVVSSLAVAMANPTLATARVAWQAIDSCNSGFGTVGSPTCSGWGGPLLENSIHTFNTQHKTDFYSFLQYLPAAGGTPLRTALDRVGQFLQKTGGANGPWGYYPNWSSTLDPTLASAPTGAEASCRKNFNIIVTDGEWNLTGSPVASGGEQGAALCGGDCGAADSTSMTLPDGTAYQPGAATSIYSNDAPANYGSCNGAANATLTNVDTLADVAFYYWSHDLNPDGLTNNVSTLLPNNASYWDPHYDPANWHHLVNFTVGLGLDKFMTYPPLWGGSTYAGAGYQALVNGTQSWPPVAFGDTQASCFAGFNGTDDPAKVYDLWHAAINSRGQAFSASSPQGLINALDTFINAESYATSGASTAIADTTSFRTGTDLFQASYQSSDWHGTIRAFPLVFNGNGSYTVNTGQIDWTTDNRGPTGNSSAFPTPASRNIVTFSAPSNTTPTPNPVPYALPLLQASLQTAGLWTTPLVHDANVLAWLRGDATNEQSAGNPAGTLRARATSILGDIVNSNPAYSYNENFGYASLPASMGGGLPYTTYLTQAKVAAGRPKMLYVGANDGMLHGFAIQEDATGRVTGGAEQFAYMPNSVLGNVSALASTNYTHQFFVDGSPFVGDAYFGYAGASPAWHSVLIGQTGAGGKSVFALDVTNPQNFGARTGDNGVLWEVDATTPDGNTVLDGNLGYTIGQAIIAPLNDGKWYAIFGNGYDSARQCAVLYLVELATGIVHTIDTTTGTLDHPGTANCAASNGLGSPTLFDVNADRVIDYVYAGDQQGNLWRFDLTSKTASNWNVPSPGGAPIAFFQALSPNPPNAPQPITAAPEIGPAPAGHTGWMLYFGTGRFFATTDPGDLTVQSFYGINDPGTQVTATISRANGPLLQQTITPIAGPNGPESGRSLSQNTLAPADKGWYIDFNVPNDAGERVLSTPLVLDGDVFFSTVVPSTSTCQPGGTSFIMAVNAGTGGGGGTDGAFFRSILGGADGILSSVGVVTGLGSISDPANANDIILAGGPGGVQAFSMPTGLVPQRTSWQEIMP